MTKKLYDRSSEEVPYPQLPAAFRTAISSHVEEYGLPTPWDTVLCCRTRSRRLYRNGLLARLTGSADRDVESVGVAVLTARHLIVLTHGEHRGTTVLSAPLSTMRTHGHPRLPEGARDEVLDSGFSVWVHWSRFPEGAAYHVAAGDDPAGHRLREALAAAVRQTQS
ncbi:hypothetical protein [Streptomyces shenzhenensis]|uniref:hypothetical protein n=1 Tax=Streptomyces shenzhenensis TaxID=943815 RepID=UPI0015F112CB|nr:hypothetical protein [Streptomyces shenzhenensis]